MGTAHALGGASEQRVTWHSAADEAARTQAEVKRWSDELDALRSSTTYRALDGATLRGVTAQRWSTAHQAADAAESMLQKVRATLADVTRRLRSEQRTDAALEQVRALLNGDAVKLDPAERSRMDMVPPWSRSSEPRFSLTNVKGRIISRLYQARHLVADVAVIQGRAAPRLAAMAAELELLRANADPVADAAAFSSVGSYGERLDALRRTVAEDPLSLARSRDSMSSTLDTEQFERLAAQLSEAVDGLAVSVRSRARLAGRLDALDAAIDELAAVESLARDRLDAALVKRAATGTAPAPTGSIPAMPVPAAPGTAGRLRASLQILRTRAADDWRAVEQDTDSPDSVAALENAIAAARQAARDVTAWADAIPATGGPCVREDCPARPHGVIGADGFCDSCYRAPFAPGGPGREVP